MVDKSTLIRRGQARDGKSIGMMAFAGPVYECSACHEYITLDADVPYDERDDRAAAAHTCKAV